MAEQQPPNLVEGATSGDIEDEVLPTAKSAEDRKAAAALSKLDARGDDDGSPGREIDQEAVKNAMSALDNKKGVEKKEVKKVKVDAADVALLVRFRPGDQAMGGGGGAFTNVHRSRSWSCPRLRLRNCLRRTTGMQWRP